MLLYRSIFLQVCLFLTLTRCNCQDYESSYSVDESDDNSQVQDDSGHPDYSKYYASDTSAPLVSAQDFGESVKQEVAQPKNPFVQQDKKTLGFLTNQQFPDFSTSGTYPVDYFEEAQKTQQKENREDGDSSSVFNPDYISHHLEGGYSSDVEKVEPKPLKGKNTKKSYKYEDAAKQATAQAEKYKTPEYSYEYQPSSGKYADYSVGKSSSTVSQHPQAAGYYEKLTSAPTATPYQKYSFQPVTEGFKSKYLGDLISTVAPFNPAYSKVASTAAPTSVAQPSDNVPSHLKDKNCRRIRKHIPEGDGHDRRKREAMNCYVCEDPVKSSKYTQCSYAVEPEPINDYSGISERYSIPAKQPGGFRYKRYTGSDYNTDPYEYIKERTHKSFTEPQPIKEYEEYKVPDFYNEEIPDKSYSELQTEALTKNPANCHKEVNEGMTCTICKDPKTGGNFEQCSYTSEPKEQKYAYVAEKKYDSNDEPAQGSESKPVVQTKEAETIKKAPEEKKVEKIPENHKPFTNPNNDNSKFSRLENFKPAEEYKANYRGHDKFKLSDEYNSDFKSNAPNTENKSKKEKYYPSENYQSGPQGSNGTPKKLIDDEPYNIPKHFAESTIKEKKTGVRGLEPSLYGSSDSSEAEEGGDADSSSKSGAYKDLDEYHFKLFPEFSNQESQQAQVVTNRPADDQPSRKDVEEVLAEFSRKDRSACKKAEKNGMTCYLCVDKKGIQHEECMYVSESKPQASHVAYHEVQQLKSPDEKKPVEQAPAATEVKEQFNKGASTSAPFTMEAAASQEIETKVRYKPTKNRRRNVKKATSSNKEPVRAATNYNAEKLSEDEEPRPKAPAEFVVGDEEGAFSAETKPVYSKTLGVKLPRYMIEKSEFEKEFDEFAGNY
ncbi:microtubule-associated protein futsch-like [Asbolus verrucosus]|uniref:Microtubule-associated protein futsch-like n=1 Tax=Asbolus verrucosus TaxID=1661398 RepID=A0A482VIN4_ASBVE|nr:microtubule-associated protein futsch-like [Asbolus verrucosus]